MGMKLTMIMMALLVAMGLAFSWYYNDTQQRMKILIENVAKAETAVNLSEQALTSMKKNYEKANEQLNVVNSKFALIRVQNSVLASKLAKMDDLGLLAVEKTEKIKNAVNRGTNNAGRCFELLSGAPLNDKEKEAKDAKTFNKECPWLWSGNTATQ